ncbi:hypothetical protein H7F51_02600 [Novosphingobium flavum]|uniref:Uncharacterized protein n=1 Tax=Novosphingobium flavum TaxID=1778672 RepID=A0A7X1FPC8_9SPHN|nr:hypothetical protein [Novosphingobium flavum]MBC2664403.1 hypothetical protein [Novosphingobium flavum]
MTESIDAARARRRVQIEQALAKYPHLSPEGLRELTDYFAREASALDVGLIASNEAIAAPYRQFRAERIDPLKGRDWLVGMVIALAVAAVVAALLWRAF